MPHMSVHIGRSLTSHSLCHSVDLTLPLVDEKSPLPAIIVTPSSPTGTTDFSIAFLAPKPKPSLRERVASCLPQSPIFSSEQPISLATTPTKSSFASYSVPFKARSIFIMLVLLFVMACHMIAHRFAITPRMDFRTKGLGLGEVGLADAHIHGGLSQSQPNAPRVERSVGWFGFWETLDDAPDFVVADMGDAEGATDALPHLA